ncbi:MAG: ATP phosphoribosyltransferase regulatory subunit [Archangium sp.]
MYQPKAGENALGTAGTVCGGGRYDRLVHELGGPEKPAVGFAMGMDRLVLLLEKLSVPVRSAPTLFIGTFDGPERDDAIALVMALRNEGFNVDFDPRGGKIGKQKERASKLNAAWFAGYGGTEHASKKLNLDNMRLPKDAPKETVEITLDGLRAWLNDAGKRSS